MAEEGEGAVVVRPATPADATAVAAIFAHYVTNTVISFAETPPSPAEWAARIQAPLYPFVVAEAAGRMLGFGYVAPWRAQAAYRFTVENGVYVEPASTGGGIGTRLLEALIAACRHAGFEQMVAVIAVNDDVGPASIRLHERLGFRYVGTLEDVGHKHGRRVGTALMQLDLRTAAQGR